VLGTKPDLYGGPYGSDLRLLQGLGGIPTIQYGPGDARAAHAPNEWVPIEETIDCARVLARLIVEVCA
jgi:acetylornithine deacetylase